MRVGGLIALILFPFQVWFAYEIWKAWPWWWTLILYMVLAFMGNRAARAPWLTQLLFPGHAQRHETRRHIFQGILFLGAAVTFYLPTHAALYAPATTWPYPWLALAVAATLVKASVR